MKRLFITFTILLIAASLLGCHEDKAAQPASSHKIVIEPVSNDTAVIKTVAEPEKTVAIVTETVPKTDSTTKNIGIRSGKVIYDLHCAGCHAAGLGHAATMKLELARAEGMAVLVQRTDLTNAYISHIVRDGLLEMPPFRPTDINDEELKNLAQYMIEQGKAYKQQDTNNE